MEPHEFQSMIEMKGEKAARIHEARKKRELGNSFLINQDFLNMKLQAEEEKETSDLATSYKKWQKAKAKNAFAFIPSPLKAIRTDIHAPEKPQDNA